MLNGVDVSVWQNKIDWAAAKPSVDFAYARATSGEDYVDTQFARNHDIARERGIPFGAYHFYVFGDDPHDQADLFIRNTFGAGRAGTLLPMVDVESGLGNVSDLSAFITDVEAQLKGQRVIIYTPEGFWDAHEDSHGNPYGMGGSTDFAGHPLWVANFTDAPSPAMPAAWQKYVIWQWADNGAIAGIGNVDLDRCPDLAAVTRVL